jgi:peptidylprolyl isomerase
MTLFRSLAAAVAAFVALAVAPALAQGDPANTLVMETSKGRVVIELRPDLAPKHVEQIKTLAGRKIYDGVVFHRVIEGFMAQTGDPTGTGMGSSDLPDIPAEFSDESFERGVVGMARAADPDSANSQFFIMFAEGPFLNGQYTVVGKVTEGMDVIDQINRGEPPASPDKIVSLRLASEAN